MTFAACRDKLAEYLEPIVVLEWRRFQRRERAGAIALFLFVGAPFVTLLFVLPEPAVRRQVFKYGSIFCLAFIALVIAAYGGRAQKQDKKSGTWAVLAITSLTSQQIADQKAFSTLVPAAAIIIAWLLFAATAIALDAASVFGAVGVGAILLLDALVIAAVTTEHVHTGGGLRRITAGRVAMALGLLFCGLSEMMRPLTPGHNPADKHPYGSIAALLAVLLAMIMVWALTGLIAARLLPKTFTTKGPTAWAMTALLVLPGTACLLPGVRSLAISAVTTLGHFVRVCAVPVAAIGELSGNNVTSCHSLLPPGLPHYAVTVGTYALHLSALPVFRWSAERSIERARRAA